MARIVLCTLNARYHHAAFGLRCLRANLGELREESVIVELDLSQRPVDMAEKALAHRPAIVGLGVYIWNVGLITQLAADIKRICPDVVLVLGGPEISFETAQQEITRWADYVIRGEADLAFADLCRELLGGRRPAGKIITAPPPPLAGPGAIVLPGREYTDEDIAHRTVYVEASRGCPFGCEFCLSSLDVPLRSVPLDEFLVQMQELLDRGLRQFKFVDRTFNVNIPSAEAILQFFLERWREGMFLHFEVIPDRLPESLRLLLAQFPPGAVQLEVGIQTFNADVAARIGRRQDNAKAEENLRFLRDLTGVHIHADLIAGLPGEDLASFAAGFDRLVRLRPQEIQVGILKRLRGAPIARHDEAWGMVYSANPPYEVLRTGAIDFAAMQRLRRLARYWDMVVNSGYFQRTTPLIWGEASAFAGMIALSDWLYRQTGRTHGIALHRLAELVFEYLTAVVGRPADAVADAMAADHVVTRREVPDAVRRQSGPARQTRHRSRSLDPAEGGAHGAT